MDGGGVIPASHNWRTNSELLRDAWRLGYVKGHVLDTTPGLAGLWWRLIPVDPFGQVTEIQLSTRDFRRLPYGSRVFDTVAFDPPYKLNGNPRSMPALSRRYGVEVPASWQDRHALMVEGLIECIRVCVVGGHILVKCQDQVSSGAVRWQTDLMSWTAEKHNAMKVDRMDMTGHGIPQPMEGREQRHAHGRPSTLLVFKKMM